MEPDFSLSAIFSTASITIAIMAIIIAWISPHRSEKIKGKKQAQQIHFDKIKSRCLDLLVSGIDNVASQFPIQ